METGSQAAALHSHWRHAAAAGGPQGGQTAQPQPAPQIYYGILPPPWLWGRPFWIMPAAVPQTAAQTNRTGHAAAPQVAAQGSPAAAPTATDEAAVPAFGITPPASGTSPQTGAAVPPAKPVQQMAPVRLVPGVAPVPYPVLPEGTRNRRYWL